MTRVGTMSRISTQLAGLDHVLGGGLVCGTTVLLIGQTGVGTTALTTQMLRGTGERCLYVTTDSTSWWLSRLTRDAACMVDVLFERNIEKVLTQIDRHRVVVLDELHLYGLREEHQRKDIRSLVQYARDTEIPVWLSSRESREDISWVGSWVGHEVDMVIQLQRGDQFDGRERILRCSKNRFGPSDRRASFEITSTGLV